MIVKPEIFLACDTVDIAQCRYWAELATRYSQGLKLGLEFYSRHGPEGLRAIQTHCPDLPLFLDLKFHDIPNTVGAAMRGITETITPAYINVHASGGEAMMRAARDNCSATTRVLAVTVLTALDRTTLARVGQGDDYNTQALRLGELAQASGLDGVVCSAHELTSLRARLGENFVCMVPGIRPASAAKQDQKRVMTPEDAKHAGASHLVIGRPITQATDPEATLNALCRELETT